MAVALAALDATVHVEGRDGPRTVALTDFHHLPGDQPERDTVLEHGELITALQLPAPSVSSRSAYRKVRERRSFAFALVSVAAVLELAADGTIADVRIALGSVAPRPWRASRAERALRDAVPDDAAFTAALDAELAQAQPLPDNGYKVALARNAAVALLSELASR
jgi:xanthine dehydrogenase YagS FAD-binding subunit